MQKPLSEMTNEELWALFPIKLVPYNPAWPAQYRREKARIQRAAGEGVHARIRHIGSTSVPGLTAKPTVDILMEIPDSVPVEAMDKALESIGYIGEEQMQKPPPHRMYMKGYTPQGFAEEVFHLHLRHFGDWDEPYFCRYLRDHPDTLAQYAALKGSLAGPNQNNRDAYTEQKGSFVHRITQLARSAYGCTNGDEE